MNTTDLVEIKDMFEEVNNKDRFFIKNETENNNGLLSDKIAKTFY